MAKKAINMEERSVVEEEEDKLEGAKSVAESAETSSHNFLDDAEFIDVDNTFDEVIQFDKEGKILQFDHRTKFLALPEQVVRKLSRANAVNYAVTQQNHARWIKLSQPDSGRIEINDPLDSKAIHDLGQIPADSREWHYFWALPRDVRGLKAAGYKEVWVNAKGEETEDHDKGKGSRWLALSNEHGETKDSNVELYALKVKQDLYRQHLKAVADKSRQMMQTRQDAARESLARIHPSLKVMVGEQLAQGDWVQ